MTSSPGSASASYTIGMVDAGRRMPERAASHYLWQWEGLRHTCLVHPIPFNILNFTPKLPASTARPLSPSPLMTRHLLYTSTTCNNHTYLTHTIFPVPPFFLDSLTLKLKEQQSFTMSELLTHSHSATSHMTCVSGNDINCNGKSAYNPTHQIPNWNMTAINDVMGWSRISSKLPSKITHSKTQRNIILPLISDRCETWSLTLQEEHRLRVLRMVG